MQKNTFFTVKKLGNGITLIQDRATVQCYLVEGTEQAALIDTGTGIGNLKSLVAELTSLPYMVLNTHGHVDHAGGNHNFEEVRLSKRDEDLVRTSTSVAKRLDFARSFFKRIGLDVTFKEEDFPVSQEITYHFVQDRECIDLGQRTLTCIPVTGHTKGSLGFLDSAAGAFFAGDAGNPSTFLFLEESATVAEYRESLLSLMQVYQDIAIYYICHAFDSIPKTCITDLIECCDRALEGNDSGIPFSFINSSDPNTVWAFPVDNKGMRTDGKIGNLIFNKTRLGV